MSAAVVAVFTAEPASMPFPTDGSTLRLVASEGKLIAGERGRVRGCPTLRFTRRGRVVVTILAVLAVAALTLLLAASVDAAPPQIDHATTVMAGQTLSEVAATQLPALPIPDGVARIQLANGLSTSEVHAGQRLLIPALP
jgi:hypothetical protein